MPIMDNNARDCIPITPTDNTLLAKSTAALYIGGAGTLRVITEAERDRQQQLTAMSGVPIAAVSTWTKRDFAGLIAGSILNLRVVAVDATGTSATLIVGLLP